MRSHNTHACPAMHMLDPCMSERLYWIIQGQKLAAESKYGGAHMLVVCGLCLLSAA